MLNFRLQVFKSVAKNLNFNKASSELLVTLPTVTNHIRDLERLFNLRLFERFENQLSLTRPGKVLLNYTEKYFSLLRGDIVPPSLLPRSKSRSKSFLHHLVCSSCGKVHPIKKINQTCLSCNKPLITEYSIQHFDKYGLFLRPSTMWRYREMLPVIEDENIVSLGEGMTPLLQVDNLAQTLGLNKLLIKDESLNPTGSFKARGLSAAVSKAKELGIKKCAIPTAGNAGGALSAYCAKAKIEAHVFMPRDTPEVFKQECLYHGAKLTLVEGNINHCGKLVDEKLAEEGWFNMSTLKEPYRIEGKKTMGYEIAEQLDWVLPDVLIYPTGGGTGLIGIWKAFEEMENLGWIGAKRPRMIAVQAQGCAPIVNAYQQGLNSSTTIQDPHTIANGLRVPKPLGDFLILDVLQQSNGIAVAVTDQEILRGVKLLASKEGMLVAPEGGALIAGLQKLLSESAIHPHEKIVLINTGHGHKYLEVMPHSG